MTECSTMFHEDGAVSVPGATVTLMFEANCRICGGPITYIGGGNAGTDRSRVARLRCTNCSTWWKTTVTLDVDEEQFPVAPLLDAVPVVTGRPLHPFGLAGDCPACPACVSLADWAAWSGMSQRRISERIRSGLIPLSVADRICVALGLHLEHVWPTVDQQLAEVG